MFNKIPGFRSGKMRNKIIAVIGYVILLLSLLTQISSAPTGRDAFVDSLFVLLIFAAILIPVANLFSLKEKFYLMNRPSKRGKIFGYLGYIVISCIVIGIVLNMESDTAKATRAQKGAQTNAERLAKAQADTEAKTAEAKVSAEQGTKAKTDADAKAKADADAKAKADLEAKAKVEADAKAKAEVEAKAQAEANKPENVAKNIVHKVFGETNSYDKKDSILDLNFNNDNGFLLIRVFAKDNFTEKLIKEGMWMDAHDVLKALKDNTNIKTVAFNIVMPLQDAYGKESNDNVMKMEFSPETRSKINWENFMWSGMPKIAENYWEHPVVRKIQTN